MRQSKLFTKTTKDNPKGEEAKNAQLLIRAGFINKEMAGVYSFLPLGLKVMKNIEEIIREEMNQTLEAQEIFMSALHPVENYKKTGRDNIDILFDTKLATGRDLVLGQSHEEIVVPLVKNHLFSYRDLPFSVYQIQNKFRNELRAKSGILRGREFLMKDLYSFHQDEEGLVDYYEKAKEAYKNIFEKVGIGDKTYLTFADGGTFSKYSHEFQTVTEAGEDLIYLCEDCNLAINEEIIEEQKSCPNCKKDKNKLVKKKSIEVGNIFKLKRKFSDPFDLSYTDEEGEEKPVYMGCYGIGVGRLMGSVVEINSDQKGMIWPESIAPFKIHLIAIGEKAEEKAEEIYKNSEEEILYDDRRGGVGEKFADADLIGLPYRIVISDKTLKEDSVEVKKRGQKEEKLVKIDNLQSYV
jgi:prolyl-tRNA synthetase